VIYNNSYHILKGPLGIGLSYLGGLSSTAIYPKFVGMYLILPENSFQLGDFLFQSAQPSEFIFFDTLHRLSSDLCSMLFALILLRYLFVGFVCVFIDD
jgi:hypothetical protein